MEKKMNTIYMLRVIITFSINNNINIDYCYL